MPHRCLIGHSCFTVYHVRFRFRGKEYKKSLKIRDESAALAAKNLVELTIHRLATGQISVPIDVNAADFIVSGGTLLQPMRHIDPVPKPEIPSTKLLIEEQWS